jgi:hypothetical protein
MMKPASNVEVPPLGDFREDDIYQTRWKGFVDIDKVWQDLLIKGKVELNFIFNWYMLLTYLYEFISPMLKASFFISTLMR